MPQMGDDFSLKSDMPFGGGNMPLRHSQFGFVGGHGD